MNKLETRLCGILYNWFLWYDLNLKPIGLYREMAVGLDDIQTELADLDIEVASYF